MNIIARRLEKLEQEAGGGRLIVVSRPRDMSDVDLERFFDTQGVATRTEDLVVSIKRLGDGHAEPWVSVDGRRLDLAQPA